MQKGVSRCFRGSLRYSGHKVRVSRVCTCWKTLFHFRNENFSLAEMKGKKNTSVGLEYHSRCVVKPLPLKKKNEAHKSTHVDVCPHVCSGTRPSLQLDRTKSRRSPLSESLLAMNFLPVVIGFAKYFKE